MQGFVQGADRQQTTLLPECLDDWVDEGNSIRAVDVFVDALELRDLGFDGVDPGATGRPAYHPSPMLKLYIHGYLNRVQSSRRLNQLHDVCSRDGPPAYRVASSRRCAANYFLVLGSSAGLT
jgi:transposase